MKLKNKKIIIVNSFCNIQSKSKYPMSTRAWIDLIPELEKLSLAIQNILLAIINSSRRTT